MVFVLIDPTGWKKVIASQTLAPLLRKRNVEMLINVMWNFIALASGHAHQDENLRNVLGENFRAVLRENRGMRTYLQRLKDAAGDAPSTSRLRAAWFPVEFPSRESVYYNLTYVTHHVKGLIVFLEESEKALKYQQQVKFVVSQQQRERESRMRDFFGDEIDACPTESSQRDARELWLSYLPQPYAELRVDEERIADMAEQCGCLISHLQDALRDLIKGGILCNVDARRPRPKNVVDYRKGETVRRLK
jgi:hypothetical protein